MTTDKERWEYIPGLDNFYMANRLGKVKSIDRVIPFMKKHTIRRFGKILKTNIGRDGYEMVTINYNGSQKTLYIHRLVAKTFVDNPENKLQVNHKNGIKTDNRVINLEWVTHSENTKHSFDYLGRVAMTKQLQLKYRAVKVTATNLKTNKKTVFTSKKEAIEKLKISGTHIYLVARGKIKPSKGYDFKMDKIQTRCKK
jgi:hypothetical protein